MTTNWKPIISGLKALTKNCFIKNVSFLSSCYNNKFVLIAFTFTKSLVMFVINKTMDYFICKNYLHHNKKYYN